MFGHLAYQTGSVPYTTYIKLKATSEGAHNAYDYVPKDHYIYQLALQNRKEQETRSTIDIHHMQIESSQRIYQMIDTPGNQKYIRHMIKGVV